MTPGQARVALLSFLLVTTGVAVNALFLQTRSVVTPKPAIERAPTRPPTERARKSGDTPRIDRSKPSAPQAGAGEQTLRIAHFAPDTTKLDAPPQAPQGDADIETVRAIQRELKARGYGPLTGDGVIGLTTRAAIMAFEHDHGLGLTGEASEDLLRRILLGASPDIEPAGAAKVRSVEAEQVIRTVQQRLTALGYRIGRVDGWLGEDTVKAIRDFEMDKGLVPKGRICAELVARLSVAAAPKPKGR
jgi:peptidoglycan hydrolase-like protein with peptidoglycan-binding domain